MPKEAMCAAEADEPLLDLGTYIGVDFIGILGCFDMNSIWLNGTVGLSSGKLLCISAARGKHR